MKSLSGVSAGTVMRLALVLCLLFPGAPCFARATAQVSVGPEGPREEGNVGQAEEPGSSREVKQTASDSMSRHPRQPPSRLQR